MRKLALVAMLVLLAMPAIAGMPITPSAFKVESRQVMWFAFRVTERLAKVEGRFESRGGSDNRIRCLILDQENLDNLKNEQPMRAYYDSGSVVVANVSARLARGDYFVVFDNREGWLTSRSVWSNIQLNPSRTSGGIEGTAGSMRFCPVVRRYQSRN